MYYFITHAFQHQHQSSLCNLILCLIKSFFFFFANDIKYHSLIKNDESQNTMPQVRVVGIPPAKLIHPLHS